jgi:hypothetical protein
VCSPVDNETAESVHTLQLYATYEVPFIGTLHTCGGYKEHTVTYFILFIYDRINRIKCPRNEVPMTLYDLIMYQRHKYKI